jgi:exodeoxyribonuclease-3
MGVKIATYNVNGIRAAVNKGLLDWLAQESPDVVCFQEVKANSDQLDQSPFEALGYSGHWFSAEKKGYSGVAIFSKLQPKHVERGCGNPLYDAEGRVIRLDFDSFSVMSVYHPSGTTGDVRQAFKMEWLEFFQDYVLRLSQTHKHLVLSGDYNICNKAIDIHNPVANAKTSGFLPEERAWFDGFLERGFTDAFRAVNPNPNQYTWWTFRANARERNLGWRIDYNLVSHALAPAIANSYIQPHVQQSDHCPCVVVLNL